MFYINFFWGKTLQNYLNNLYSQIFNTFFFWNKIFLTQPNFLHINRLFVIIILVNPIFKKRIKYTHKNKKHNFSSSITPFFSYKKYLKFFNEHIVILLIMNRIKNIINRFFNKKIYLNLLVIIKTWSIKILFTCKTIFGEGFLYIRGLLLIFFIDASFTDDEPLWEPIEWSLVLTWILFIFIFAWIAENLITSRFGSYTGRDKRVWFGWYKTFWLLEGWFAISYGIAAMMVIIPFYSELTYSISFTVSWWHWYTRAFFFKFISLYSISLMIAFTTQMHLRWFNWKKLMMNIVIINLFLSYLLYTHFIMTFFGYFTDPLWYQKTRFIDYVQLSHEPWKWGWGPAKRDHFSYHKVSTVFWFKNDGPYASALLMMHMFFFISLFLLYIYWLTLLRRTYTTKEITITFFTYCVSALKQFFFLFFLFYIFIFISFIGNYWRLPIEFIWTLNTENWGWHFTEIVKSYPYLLLSIITN